MVEIETFLRNMNGEFVRVEDSSTPPVDLDYIEGAIRLSIGGVEIIGLEEWDYVDQLWCYVVDMISQFRSSGAAETYFPDQPIKLTFQAIGPQVLVSAEIGEEVRRGAVSSVDLLDALKAAGTVFFDKISELAQGNSYIEARRGLSV